MSVDSIGFINTVRKNFEFHKSGRLFRTAELLNCDSAAVSSYIEFASSLCNDDVAQEHSLSFHSIFLIC